MDDLTELKLLLEEVAEAKVFLESGVAVPPSHYLLFLFKSSRQN
jgi:hypothetical protein